MFKRTKICSGLMLRGRLACGPARLHLICCCQPTRRLSRHRYMPLSGASDGGIAVDEINGRWPANPRKHWRFRLFHAGIAVLPETTVGGRSRNTLEVSVYPMVTILLHVFAGKPRATL